MRWVCWSLSAVFSISFGVSVAAQDLDFENQIRPILIRYCSECHGPKSQKGGLRLDVRHTAIRGGDSGPAIVGGDASNSELIRRIESTDPEQRMPPKGMPVPASESALLRMWIDSGADWPETEQDRQALTDPRTSHWAWQPIRHPAPPQSPWQHPIDAFLHANLQTHSLTFAAQADRRTLIRRATLVLTGLLPDEKEIEAFERDSDTDAFNVVIDRLLNSPAYGERQAVHWLDVVRFSESDGFEEDSARPEAWTYRDYVIDAFNRDLPYDQFVREQIAGDVLQPITGSSIAATGMLVAGPWDSVQRITPSRLGRLQSREEQLEEIVGAVSQTFMAVTVNCARCHDHKFDPVPQSDYYSLKSVFEGIDHGLTPKTHGLRRRMGPTEEQQWNSETLELRQKIDSLATAVKTLEEHKKAAGTNWNETQQQELDQSHEQLQASQRELSVRHPVVMAFVGDREQPQPTVVFDRGDVQKPGKVVQPAGLSLISLPGPDLQLPADAPEAERRIRFAHWLTHPKHPLTARVIVNRIWQQHFGAGLVGTPGDFGINGDTPSHPELLDWLATEFIQSGWSIKSLHRMIIRSHAWQQQSVIPESDAQQAVKLDADNRLLWRFPLRPLEGEVVRDTLLQLSGSLNHEMGGPSFKPYTTSRLNTYFYHLFDRDESQYNRRTIYRMHIITGRSPFLDALDCPSPSIAVPRRRPTVTPIQALALMNDPFVLRQAEKMAEQLTKSHSLPSDQIRAVFNRALNRLPSVQESRLAEALAAEEGLTTVCWAIFNTSEFLSLR
ncbi:MAG: DUF1553 domain-containing protein [Planctomyces sp.]|nr:DUF1553 domain-containing protein [Planctomyces sp.]